MLIAFDNLLKVFSLSLFYFFSSISLGFFVLFIFSHSIMDTYCLSIPPRTTVYYQEFHVENENTNQQQQQQPRKEREKKARPVTNEKICPRCNAFKFLGTDFLLLSLVHSFYKIFFFIRMNSTRIISKGTHSHTHTHVDDFVLLLL